MEGDGVQIGDGDGVMFFKGSIGEFRGKIEQWGIMGEEEIKRYC